MELIYVILFVIFALLALLLQCTENACLGSAARRRAPLALDREYVHFRNNYVVVFSLMMAGDWLQGPYVYHLYEHYGYSVKDIGRLFIMGFGSSAAIGTIAGAMADSKGRKQASLMYVIVYSLSCLTKHSSNYWVLMLGRLLGGIATSLLFSAFESWAVAAHSHAGFEQTLLSDLFTKAVFLGNGIMAIASGLLGNILVEDLHLGPVAPFDAAILVLVAGGLVIHLTWEENFGDRAAGAAGQQFKQALTTISEDPRVALLGASQALFESSMYTFVFLWTPALSPQGEKLPHGFVFAIFMTASLVGTALAGRLANKFKLEQVMQVVFWCSAVTLFVPVLFHMQQQEKPSIEALLQYGEEYYDGLRPVSSSSSSNHKPPRLLLGTAPSGLTSRPVADGVEYSIDDYDSSSSSSTAPRLSPAGAIQLVAFCMFEILIGMFWPVMMTLRAKYVPEEQRSTIINTFRIPLNMFVCIILWKVSDFPLGVIFALCSLFLVAAACCQYKLSSLAGAGSSSSSSSKYHVSDHDGCEDKQGVQLLQQQQGHGASPGQQQQRIVSTVKQHIAP